MKYFKTPFLLFTLMAVIVSCSSDDSGPTTTETDEISGTWNLIEINVNPAVDANNDGTSNSNLLSELDCLNGTLTFNTDGSWSSSITDVDVTSITGGLFFVSCSATVTDSGTWQFMNNQVSAFSNTLFETGILVLDGNRLTATLGEDLPSFQNIVYEKQ